MMLLPPPQGADEGPAPHELVDQPRFQAHLAEPHSRFAAARPSRDASI